jgi:hypothetical protein
MARVAALPRLLSPLTLAWGLTGLASAQTLVQFPSLDGPPATLVDAYLFKPEGT